MMAKERDEEEMERLLMSARLTSLEQRVNTLEGKRPGRRALPIVVSKEHVCGVAPDTDSVDCPHASLYRRHNGCKGDACVALSKEYYAERRHNAKEG